MTCPSAISSIVIVVSLGCTHGRPTRIVAGINDTVVINSTRESVIPVVAFDQSGRTVPVRTPTFEQLPGDSVRVSVDGRVRCTRPGDASVRASVGTLSTVFILYCRPMRRLKFGNDNYGLFVGGPSRPLDVVGVGLDGRPVTLMAARIRVDDSSVVGVDHGLITPKRRGMAKIVVEAGDSQTSYRVEVLERAAVPDKLQIQQAFIEPVTLTRNGTRAWPVGQGRYEVSFIPDDSLEHSVLLAATGANCARYSDGRAHLSCVVRDSARVFVAMPEAPTRRASLTGRLVIRRLGDPSVMSDYWFDTRAYAFIK